MNELAKKLQNIFIDLDRKQAAKLKRKIAIEAGISVSTVGQIIRGEIKYPPEKRLRGFAKVLGLPEDQVITWGSKK